MKHIEKAWNSFERMVLPADVSAIQRNETRKAFYAGASCGEWPMAQALSN